MSFKKYLDKFNQLYTLSLPILRQPWKMENSSSIMQGMSIFDCQYLNVLFSSLIYIVLCISITNFV